MKAMKTMTTMRRIAKTLSCEHFLCRTEVLESLDTLLILSSLCLLLAGSPGLALRSGEGVSLMSNSTLGLL